MAVNSISSNTGVAAQTSASSASGSVDDAQSNFMKLLVAQMQNQDPMNPMDNAQMTSQMAQLNMVSGINQLNTTLSSALSSFQATQTMQASSLIGREVLVPSSTLQLSAGQAKMGVDLAQSADSLKLTVLDSTGQVLRTMDLGASAAGVRQLSWDGATDAGAAAADGSYSFKLEALRNGQSVTATALSAAQVGGVSLSNNNVRLSLPGLGEVALADVRQVR
ncbi:flagellar hook assembly protein FlgD [Malikia granosa]|uniref:Basal-body rod modification protein FlgD n=1 Tax=Malikia granosa TaxID=263067 RepID=A0A2S9K4D4_9BURK|nr:flagellar hook assembly protein FlgD [Malikia granosa]PRD65320.1 flagellar biosynthesis protein FlgD [Malikia granosa]